MEDMIGKVYSHLTVIEEDGRSKDRRVLYKCLCSCGNTTIVPGCRLREGKIKSCGCRQGMTHGGAHDRLYDIWGSMRSRCHKTKGYENISVCNEWQDYSVFKEWAYANGYDENAPQWKCTIDRIDVNGNYEPNNCRWVDESVQMFNRRKAKSKLGVRGVYQRDNKYYAMISKNRKQIYLGCFERIEDAIAARKAGEMKYYGMTLEA